MEARILSKFRTDLEKWHPGNDANNSARKDGATSRSGPPGGSLEELAQGTLRPNISARGPMEPEAY